jgi:hypothetical protein
MWWSFSIVKLGSVSRKSVEKLLHLYVRISCVG